MPSKSKSKRTQQSTRKLPTIPPVKDMKTWNAKTVLEWVQQRDENLLLGDELDKFEKARMIGRAFLASDERFFSERCGLSPGTGQALQDLVDEVKGEDNAQNSALEKALFKADLTEKAKGNLLLLTREERIRILSHLGTKPSQIDQYGLLPSVIGSSDHNWKQESILRHPDKKNKTFTFPIIDQQALFLRKCYHELYEIITKFPSPNARSIRILLTGTPGIGKSTFLLYFIIRHLYDSSRQLRNLLIFQPADLENTLYAFASPNIVRKGTFSDFEDFFLLPTTWYLVDWQPKSKPISQPAATLFALSPNSTRDAEFKDYEKVLALSLCMPVWTYDELEKCRSHIFPELKEGSLKYIYNRVGGVPRYCLQAPTRALINGLSDQEAHDEGLRRLEDAFNEIKDPLMVLRAQEESLGVKVSGRLLHKVPDSMTSYRNSRHRVWASAYVIDRFVNMMNAHSASDMNRQVREGLASNQRDGTLGKVFECYVRHLFFKGGGVKLRKRRLDGARNKGKESRRWFTIPKNLEHKPFNGMADFSIPEGDTRTIWTPGPNFPSVDMILTPNSLFQITISKDHPVKQEPLRKIVEKLPAKQNISLYFVVPEEIFKDVSLQNYHNGEGKVSQKLPECLKTLEQWVLGVPLGGNGGNGGELSKKNAEQSEVQGMKKRTANEDDMRQPPTPKKRRSERRRNISVPSAETSD